MEHKKRIESALRSRVGSAIYARGVSYARSGRVLGISAENADGDLVRIFGTVRGSRTYKTSATCNVARGSVGELECSCPYGEDCKHAVALVTEYLASHKTESPSDAARPAASIDSVPGSSGDDIRQALASLGLSADAVPDSLIEQLLLFRSQGERASVSVGKQAIEAKKGAARSAAPNRKKPFDASKYTVMVHRDRGYAASLHRTGEYYQQTSIKKLLEDADVTDAQRTLLEYVKDHNGFQNGYYYRYEQDSATASDPSVLFPLLAESGFAVVCGSYYYNRPVTIDVHPDPVRIELLCERLSLSVDRDDVRRVLVAVQADEPKPDSKTEQQSTWVQCGKYTVHDTGACLKLYMIPPEWSNILHRGMSLYVESANGKPVYKYHGTELQAAEIEHLSALCVASGDMVQVTATPEVSSIALHLEKPKKTIAVDCDHVEQTLKVVPFADYDGVWQSNIPESISRRYTGRVKYLRRAVYEHALSHVIAEDETGGLHYIRLNDKEEIAIYKELEARYEALGFTKTLKCSRRGAKAIDRYIQTEWPTLREFAKSRGYEIIFTKDVLPKEKVFFRAEFSSDLDEERDWLHFDVELYCGDERVTLEMLYAYMESGASTFRTADGSLVEVGNREELERLVRLLKSFHAREEGGFEGRLHNAPELTYVMTSSPHYNAARSESMRAFMKRVESGKPLKPVRLPKNVKEQLRPYQRAGVEWLYFLRSYRFGGILADDMGLGKTLQALTVLAQERVEGAPSIVVCPKSLLHNWKSEAERFFPKLSVLVYEGSPAEREGMREEMAKSDLVVASYNTLKQDSEYLCASDVRYNYAVLDEAQYIKNHATKMAQTVKEIPAEYRLALTGTPLENHVFEIWSMYDYLMPGFLGKREHFSEHFHKPIMEGGDQHALAHLRKKIEGFMLRRSKNEVLTELPPKVEQVRECVLTDAQNVLYQQILAGVRGDVLGAVEKKGFKGAQIHILAGLTKLRQACNHPALLTKDRDWGAYESAKLDACLELIDEVAQSGRKALVFSQFTGMLDILAAALAERGVPYAYLSGKTRKRREVIEKFNTDPSITAFLISMKAGGTGLNLTSADTVIIFDPWWNPSVENQAVDRAHRMGQTKSVNVYRLLTKGTIEERIQALKQKKQNLFNAVVDESGDLFKKLTWDDIRALFA